MRTSTEHTVIIAGAGPTGLMLAGELALAGVDVALVEPRPDQHVDGSRAGGLYARTLEVLDQRGIAERFIAAGQTVRPPLFGDVPLREGDLPSRHDYVLALWQSRFEPILADWISELGVPVLRRREVTGFTERAEHVDIETTAGPLRARYLVGCDGGRSVVRKTAGIDFPGLEPSTSWIIAEADMGDDPPLGMKRDALGVHGLGRMGGDGAPVRVVLTERHLRRAPRPDPSALREALIDVYGTDFALRGVRWISRFTDQTRQAAAYRRGRVLLAGDAAHIHPPHGGQGLNTGVQDAVNLGWKLARVAAGTAPAALLDTYHAERHPVGARVLRDAQALVALARTDPRQDALRDTFTELLSLDEARRRFATIRAGLAIRYGGDDARPLVGRRMPDLDLHTAAGPTRLYTRLHAARPVLLTLDGTADADLGPWSDRVDHLPATCAGPCVVPLVGDVPPPPAVLIRPDGHVAWTGPLDDPALPTALTTWFGPPAAEG